VRERHEEEEKEESEGVGRRRDGGETAGQRRRLDMGGKLSGDGATAR
jgi:hypothetical protein